MRQPLVLATSTCALAASLSAAAFAQNLPRAKNPTPTVGRPTVVARFTGPMPTGVAVSREGRMFVNFPRWGDKVPFTVAEIKNGRAVPFPDREINTFLDEGSRAQAAVDTSDRSITLRRTRLVSVQNIVVDPLDRLWLVDTGSIKLGPTAPGGPKIVCVDLRTNKVVKTIVFTPGVTPSTSYLNDIRFDLRRGREGYAFITDSGGTGPNAIIVVDLATGNSRRRLERHPSVEQVPNFVPTVEGEKLMQRPKGQAPKPISLGADGIAITPTRLFYCPLASRRLYSASLDALTSGTDEQVAASVINHGEKGASDGLESDASGRIYVTDYERNAIRVRETNGTYRTLVQSPNIIWPDTMDIAENGYLYFTTNQLNRQPDYHNGRDLRQKPYSVMRVRINARPVNLRK